MSDDATCLVDVETEDEGWSTAVADVESCARLAAETALHRVGGGAVVILLTDDLTIRDLNRRFRGKDLATNVLSFPAAPLPGDHAEAGVSGDIALALGVCRAEALGQGLRLADHLAHLVIHGVLHLAGHDHHDDAEAIEMETIETALLAALGIADPYRHEDLGAVAVSELAHG